MNIKMRARQGVGRLRAWEGKWSPSGSQVSEWALKGHHTREDESRLLEL